MTVKLGKPTPMPSSSGTARKKEMKAKAAKQVAKSKTKARTKTGNPVNTGPSSIKASSRKVNPAAPRTRPKSIYSKKREALLKN